MNLRYYFIVALSLNCFARDSDFQAKIHQRRTEAHSAKQEEPQLAEFAKAGYFEKIVALYRESPRLRYKDAHVVRQLESATVCLVVYFGDMTIASLLLDRDLPVDQRDPLANTPLIWAAHTGNHEAVSFLLEKGAQVDATNNRGITALDEAYRLRHGRVAHLLVQAYMDKEPEKNWKPVPWCMCHGYKELARLLMETPLVSVPVDDVDGEGNTGLLWALRNGDRAGIQLLVAKGASTQRSNVEGVSPLSLVLQANDDELITLFAEQAAKQDERNTSRYGALTWAVRLGEVYLVRKLLRREANGINSKDQLGNTPLMWAILEGRPVIVRMLLRAGAHVDTQNNIGKSPVSIAAEKGDSAILSLLSQSEQTGKECNALGWTPLITAARYGHYDAVQTLLESNIPVDQEDSDGSTALYWAARFGHEKVVRELIKAGAGVNKKNEFGWTPLYWAAKHKHAPVVRLLLEYGAEVDPELDYGLIITYCSATQAIKRLFTQDDL